MSLKSYRELKVWQHGMELAKHVYLLVQTFPKHEVYGLSSPIQRSSVSIPANLAEGHAKQSTKDFLRHISIAQGSLAETETYLQLAVSLNYAESDRVARLLETCAEERKMLSGLRRSLRARLNGFPNSRPPLSDP